jgi:DNA-binding transcriptional LysR family regulator
MDRAENGWDLYRTFLAVVRDGSLSMAAQRLRFAQPTAGRHIQALEKKLSTVLFTRTQRGLLPTAAALSLVPHAEAMASAAGALERAATGEARGTQGSVRLTAGEMMGCEVLPPLLRDFQHSHPLIHLDINLSNRNVDLLRRDVDIAVRMIRPVQPSLILRSIGQVSLGLFAHRNYVERFGLPKTPTNIAQHILVGFDRDGDVTRSARGATFQIPRDGFHFRSDCVPAQLAAVRAGIGIGVCFSGIARKDPNLVPVLKSAVIFHRDVWLVMHRDSKATRRIRLLYDHLVENLGPTLRQLEG